MIRNLIKSLALSVIAVFSTAVSAQETYRNPVIFADAPDMSVCKVADTYYMISTTMHLMPGGPIMRSKDMVNWETISYVFDRIDDGDRYNLIDNQTVYGQGQWASSLRYHMGKFWVWFTANGAPGKGFVYCADKAEGPWTLVARPPHMHDASLFFDEDGKKYLFTGSGGCTVVELDDNFMPKKNGLNKHIIDGKSDPEENGALLEGSSVIKHNGKYYVCMISMKWGVPGRVRREVCYRADRIDGPYEKHIILETPFESYGGVGQGCIVGDDQSDKGWWALIFQDRGGVGRVPCAMPVTWVDGWPMCGELNEGVDANDVKACLNPKNYHIPNDIAKHHPSLKGIIGSDEFANAEKLSLYWQWNHNPVDEAWSLSERPGFMRLKTSRVVKTLQLAPNTLTQRMGGPECTGTVCIDVENMKDGDHCGLAALNGDSGILRIVKKGSRFILQLVEEKAVFKGRMIERCDEEILMQKTLTFKKKQKMVYLRLHGDFNPGRDMAQFAYSLDNNRWENAGREIKMTFDYTRHFMGSKFAVFNYATKKTGGYVDVDWFHYEEE